MNLLIRALLSVHVGPLCRDPGFLSGQLLPLCAPAACVFQASLSSVSTRGPSGSAWVPLPEPLPGKRLKTVSLEHPGAGFLCLFSRLSDVQCVQNHCFMYFYLLFVFEREGKSVL